jgi:hypothetical protein
MSGDSLEGSEGTADDELDPVTTCAPSSRLPDIAVVVPSLIPARTGTPCRTPSLNVHTRAAPSGWPAAGVVPA